MVAFYVCLPTLNDTDTADTGHYKVVEEFGGMRVKTESTVCVIVGLSFGHWLFLMLLLPKRTWKFCCNLQKQRRQIVLPKHSCPFFS